jgi:hypothetical protein
MTLKAAEDGATGSLVAEDFLATLRPEDRVSFLSPKCFSKPSGASPKPAPYQTFYLHPGLKVTSASCP